MLSVLLVFGAIPHPPPTWVIVADQSVPAIFGAAKDLQLTLGQIMGTTPPLLLENPTGKDPKQRNRVIIIRQDQEPEEHYWIRTSPEGILITGGGKRGAMYGVYGFLQDVLGCRWFTSKISKIPHRANLNVGHLGIVGAPAFEYREPYFFEAFNRDWDLHNRVNGNFLPLDESVGGKVSYGHFVHTSSELVPPEVYYKDHPEYFSLVDGKRQSGYAQLCLTNPDVLQIVIEKVKQWITDNPNATIFSVSQNDTYLNCQCDNCKRIEQEEGSPSGPLLRFVNKVADAIAKWQDPHRTILIDTLAYQWSEKPPLHEKPRPNVRIRLAPIGACFAHPLDGCEKNKAPFENLLAWEQATSNASTLQGSNTLTLRRSNAPKLYVWHYCTNFANYLQPLPDLDEIGKDVKLFHDHGVVGLFYEGDYAQGGGGDMAELKSYLLARLMWNPNLDPKKLTDEFLEGVYGPAADDMRQWLALMHAPARKGVDATIYDPPTAPYLTPELLSKGEALFDDAERVTKGDRRALEEVQKARVSLEYVQVMRSKPDDPRRPALVAKLAADIHRFGITETSEGGSAQTFLQKLGVK